MSQDWYARYEEEYRIVDRCWKALGMSRFEDANGKAIDEIIHDRLDEIRQLKNEVSDLNSLIAAYRKWVSQSPILETKRHP